MTGKEAAARAPLTPALIDAARRDVIASGSGSTSRLARELRVGWRVAGRLMEQLELDGVVSPADDDGGRMVLQQP